MELLTNGYAVVGIIAAVAATLFCWWFFRKRHQYVGFGWVLSYNLDKGMYVASRLLDSPAGEAGVPIGCQIISFNGKKVPDEPFASPEDFKNFVHENSSPDVGDLIFCTIAVRTADKEIETKEIVMRARKIQGPIPVYEQRPKVPDSEKWRVEEGMFCCQRTGQLVPTRRLSEDALKSIFYP